MADQEIERLRSVLARAHERNSLAARFIRIMFPRHASRIKKKSTLKQTAAHRRAEAEEILYDPHED